MRIAQITTLSESVPPRSQNGLEFVVSWITEELVARGHDVTLFAPADSKTKAKLVSILPKGTNNDTTRGGQPFFTLWNSAIAGTMSEKKKSSFDIIHTHAAESLFVAPFLKTPTVLTLHHPAWDDFLTHCMASPRLKKALAPVIKAHEKINYVAVSHNQASVYKKVRKSSYKNFSIIPNGIPVERFSFNAKPQDYLLFIGYINKAKGADVAVRVARKLGMKLILAGNNFGEEKFFRRHIKPYLGKDILYVGPVNFKQKNKLYRNAIAKLAPLTWDEPFGLTIIEAQACGTPVIAYDRGAARELIKNGKTGFVVKSEKEMIAAIKKVPSLSRKACRKNVEDNFSVTKMVDNYERLYKQLTKKK